MERPSRVFADTCDIGQRQNYAAKRRRPQNANQIRRGWSYNPDPWNQVPEVSTSPWEQAVHEWNKTYKQQEKTVKEWEQAIINTLVQIYAVAIVNYTTVTTEVLPQVVWYAVQVIYYAVKVSYAVLELVLDYAVSTGFQLTRYVQEQVVKSTPSEVVKITPPKVVQEQVVNKTPQVVEITLPVPQKPKPEQKPKTPKVVSNKVKKTDIFVVKNLKK